MMRASSRVGGRGQITQGEGVDMNCKQIVAVAGHELLHGPRSREALADRRRQPWRGYISSF